jgi:hypothetical protein
MLHDRPHHLAQRWVTYRQRSAVDDLFLGPYPALIVALTHALLLPAAPEPIAISDLAEKPRLPPSQTFRSSLN